MMWKLIILSIFLMFISGCTPVSKAFINATIDSIEEGADTTAEVVVRGPCAMTLGAYFRLTNPNERKGARYICDPSVGMNEEELE